MHQLIPVSRLIEHLRDKGLLTLPQAIIFQARATQLVLAGYTEEVIIQALFNWSLPEVWAEINRHQETPAEHLRTSLIMISKDQLLSFLREKLNGEHFEIKATFASIPDTSLLTLNQAIYCIPRHHPKTIDAVVELYLSQARKLQHLTL